MEEKTWEKIKKSLKEKDLSVMQFAESLGLTRQSLYLWKKYGVSPHKAKKVSELTGIPRAELNPSVFS
jgi:hypothetical protein